MQRYDLTYDKENCWLEFRYRGALDLKVLVDMIKFLAPAVMENDSKKFLNDMTAATIALDRIEISFIPGLIESFLFDSQWSRAIVAGEKLDDFYFFEQLARRRGQNVKVFTDTEAAKKWLTGEEKRGQ